MNYTNEKTCPRCGRPGFRPFDELSDEEKDLAARLRPEFWAKPRLKDRRVCPNCWYVGEDNGGNV